VNRIQSEAGCGGGGSGVVTGDDTVEDASDDDGGMVGRASSRMCELKALSTGPDR
jgi:hypothetical protein